MWDDPFTRPKEDDSMNTRLLLASAMAAAIAVPAVTGATHRYSLSRNWAPHVEPTVFSAVRLPSNVTGGSSAMLCTPKLA